MELSWLKLSYIFSRVHQPANMLEDLLNSNPDEYWIAVWLGTEKTLRELC